MTENKGKNVISVHTYSITAFESNLIIEKSSENGTIFSNYKSKRDIT